MSVIKVENLSKQYRLGQVGTGSLSHDLNRLWHKIRGNDDPYLKIGEENKRESKGNSDYVWALKDIHFDIEQGDRVGIIGRNGAGKSTLLKILSRTTSPTTGTVKIKGKVASLLEVGTGFHPDLSGRDNIFLNGAILGMSKRDIKSRFDEIVEFAGVERYIDTPVKRYSSGMYVRLAFAVAAHLESDILIVDEVLAVGDAEFQKKCLGKMGDVSKGEGKTVLFVSHNMAAISSLCSSSIFLDSGIVKSFGETKSILNLYLNHNAARDAERQLNNYTIRTGNNKVKLLWAGIKKPLEKEYSRLFSIGDALEIHFKIRVINPNQNKIKAAIEIQTSDGFKICNMIDVDSRYQVEYTNEDELTYSVVLSDVRLYPDIYYLSFFLGDMSSEEIYDYVKTPLSFEIVDGGNLTNRRLPNKYGLLFLTPKWEQIETAT